MTTKPPGDGEQWEFRAHGYRVAVYRFSDFSRDHRRTVVAVSREKETRWDNTHWQFSWVTNGSLSEDERERADAIQMRNGMRKALKELESSPTHAFRKPYWPDKYPAVNQPMKKVA